MDFGNLLNSAASKINDLVQSFTPQQVNHNPQNNLGNTIHNVENYFSHPMNVTQNVKPLAPQLVKPITNYFDPNMNGGNNNPTPNFWNGNIARGLGVVQNFIESPKPTTIVPTIHPFSGHSLTTNIGNSLSNIPGGLVNTIVGQGIIDPSLDFGQNLGRGISGRGPLQYSNAKSPLTRLGYEIGGGINPSSKIALGTKTNIQQVLGNAAGAALPPVTAYTGGSVFGLGGKAAKEAATQGFLNTMKSGALSSSKLMGLYGVLDGLAQNRNNDLLTQLTGAAKTGTIDAVFGGILGGGLSGGGYATGKIFNATAAAIRKYFPNASDATVTRMAGGFLRNQLGQFVGMPKKDIPIPPEVSGLNGGQMKPKGTFKVNDWQDQVSKDLGFNKLQEGKINFGAKVGGKESNAANAGLSDTGVGQPNPLTRAQTTERSTAPQVSSKIKLPTQKSQAVQVSPGDLSKSTSGANPLVSGTNLSSETSLPQAVKKIVTGEAKAKERGFITSVKESKNASPALKKVVSGEYIPQTNKEQISLARKLIASDPQTAEQLAANPQNAMHIQIGNELINHYNATGQIGKARALVEAMAKPGTEFGQAVQAFASYDKTTPQGALRFAQSKINEYNKLNPGKKLQVTDAQVKSLFARATKIQKMPEGKARNIAANELMNEVNNLIPSSVADKAITVWKAGLLTSLRTHERNLVGNTIHQAAEIVKDAPAAAADRIMGIRTGNRSMTFTTKGLAKGGKEGLQASKDIIRMGYDPTEAISKYDVRHITWGNNPLERALKIYTDSVFRTLGGADKPFWNASFARSLYDQAGAEAINAGKAGDKAFIERLVKKPTPEMLGQATKDANIATFHDTNKIGKVARAVQDYKVGGVPVGQIVAPFTGVPSSIAQQIVSYSPAGLIKGVYDMGKVAIKPNEIAGLQRQAAQEIGRGVIGSGLLGVGAYLASKGLMTGQPKDLKESKQWQLEGKPANSVMMGGKWRSIGSIGPENLVILAGAKAQQELAQGKDASLSNYGASVGKDFLGQTFLQGVQGPLNAVSDPQRYAKSYIGNQAASVVPNIVKDTAKAFDPYQRQNNTIQDYFINSIPFARNNQLPYRDVLGNPVAQSPTGPAAYYDLLNSRAPISNPVVNELGRLNNAGFNATPSNPTKKQTIKGVSMTLNPQQLDNLTKVSGQSEQQALSALFQSPDYQRLSDQGKSDAVSSLLAKVRKQVRGTIDVNNPNQNPTQVAGASSKANGKNQFTLISDAGTVKQIDLSKPITAPTLTGNSALDKKLISKYKSAITSRENDIVALYQAGKIDANRAEAELIKLEGQKGSTGGTSSKKLKVPNLSAPAIKLPTMKLPTFQNQPIAKFKSGNTNLSVPNISPVSVAVPNFKNNVKFNVGVSGIGPRLSASSLAQRG